MGETERALAAGRHARRGVRRRVAVRAPARRPRSDRVRAVLRRRREPRALVRPAPALGSQARSRRRPHGAVGGDTRPSTGRSPTRPWRSSIAVPARRCSSRTTTSMSSPGSSARYGRLPGSRTSCTSRGSAPRAGPWCRCGSRGPCTKGSSRATASASTRSGGARRSSSAARCSSAGEPRRRSDPTRTRSRSTPPSSTRLAASDAVRSRRADLQADRPEILVVRVDRTDPAKNAIRGFQAFGRLLERTPELRGRIDALRAARPVAPGDSRVRGLPSGRRRTPPGR